MSNVGDILKTTVKGKENRLFFCHYHSHALFIVIGADFRNVLVDGSAFNEAERGRGGALKESHGRLTPRPPPQIWRGARGAREASCF